MSAKEQHTVPTNLRGVNYLETPPSYPVIDSQPPLGMVFRNFRGFDYMLVGSFGLIGAVVGFRAGSSLTRRAFTIFSGGMGAFAGACAGMQNSHYRLTGHRENTRERKRYGVPDNK
mmetsp:Transcript_6573/g.11439  ORF Transcript_6573/g.11439 Transcript_6573/m.11439 type:complete len:116 (+) Transcript_6573:60-407(+)